MCSAAPAASESRSVAKRRQRQLQQPRLRLPSTLVIALSLCLGLQLAPHTLALVKGGAAPRYNIVCVPWGAGRTGHGAARGKGPRLNKSSKYVPDSTGVLYYYSPCSLISESSHGDVHAVSPDE